MMICFVILSALLLTVAADCNDHTDCAKCISSETLGTHTCYWCEVDQECHALASPESACYSSLYDDRCQSLSIYSTCNENTCRNPDEAKRPYQLHFALAGSSGFRAAWKTDAVPSSCHLVVENTVNSAVSDFVSEPPGRYLLGHGYHHTASASGLSPGVDYNFHVKCDGLASKTLSFHVPVVGRQSASFLVVSDMGWKDFGDAMLSLKQMERLVDSADLTINGGDIAYPDDSFLHGKCIGVFCYEAVYDNYMTWMENIFTKPFMVTPGNHESECHSPDCVLNRAHSESLRNFSAYNYRWRMPSQESGGVLSMWYSFDYGPVHIVSLNTETDFPNAPEGEYGDSGSILGNKCGHFAANGKYLAWLEADLKAANESRAERPWIIAMGHRTWVHRDSEPKDPEVGDVHKPLFDKYGVDLYISGHVHAYSRHLPVHGGTPIVVTGGAGNDEGLEGWPETRGCVNGYEYYSNGQVYQVGTVDVNRTTLVWKAYNSTSGEVFDEFTLKKQNDVLL